MFVIENKVKCVGNMIRIFIYVLHYFLCYKHNVYCVCTYVVNTVVNVQN